MSIFHHSFTHDFCLQFAQALIAQSTTINMQDLGFPPVNDLVESLKTEMLTLLNIVITNVIPALGIALVIRKFTS